MSDDEIINLRDALLPSQGEPFDALVFGRAIAAAAVAKERERRGPCQTCESLARTVMIDQTGAA